jgi:hypothetical protein
MKKCFISLSMMRSLSLFNKLFICLASFVYVTCSHQNSALAFQSSTQRISLSAYVATSRRAHCSLQPPKFGPSIRKPPSALKSSVREDLIYDINSAPGIHGNAEGQLPSLDRAHKSEISSMKEATKSNTTVEYKDSWFDRLLQGFLAYKIYELLQNENLTSKQPMREMGNASSEYDTFVQAAFSLNARPSWHSQRLTMQLLKGVFPSWFPMAFRFPSGLPNTSSAPALAPPLPPGGVARNASPDSSPMCRAPTADRRLPPTDARAGGSCNSSRRGSTRGTRPCPPSSSPAG